MKLKLITGLSLLVSLCSAAPVYYLTTDQTGGQTQIDVNHTSTWLLDPNTDFSFAGGFLTMKAGNNASTSVTLSLYEGTDDSGLLLGSVALTNSAFCSQVGNCGSFGSHAFLFGTPIALDSDVSYFAALTSNAPDVQSKAYFIKSTSFFMSDANGNAISPQPIGDLATTQAPEPATMGLFIVGLGLVTIPQIRRRLLKQTVLVNGGRRSL
jgi:hypothetical protein